MVEVFESLINRAPAGVFSNVEIYNSQIDRVRLGKIAINYPSLYIEIKNQNTINLGRNINRMDLSIRFHIVMVQLDAGDGSMDQNLAIFYLRDLINKTYVNFTPTNCSIISDLIEYQDYKHTNLYHYIISMKCHWTDLSAFQEYFMGKKYLVWNLADIKYNITEVQWQDAFGPLLNLGFNEP